MAWWFAIPAVISAVSAISQSGQQAQNAQAAGSWTRYNAQMGYNNTLGNLRSQMQLSKFNAAMSLKAGRAASAAAAGAASASAQSIHMTALYNDATLEEDLRLMWDAAELKVDQIEDQRAQERGTMIASQAASGTVIGEGSNEDVIVSQMAQEEMDKFIVMHGADIQAAKLTNARTGGLWQSQVQIAKVLYEGRLGASAAMNNAISQAASGLANTAIGGIAELQSAGYKLEAGLAGGNIAEQQGMQQSSNTLFNGMFSAISQGVSGYYGQKVPDVAPQLLTGAGAQSYTFPTSPMGAVGPGTGYKPFMDYGTTPGTTLAY